jgi:Brp/Blh family beta-carotene 15,15'-monooxygenase
MKDKADKLSNLNSFMIVATFFALWLAVQFEAYVENMFAYLLILSFGILHGANDLKLLQHSRNDTFSKRKFVIILGYYILFVLGSAFLFYAIPAIALLLFVVFSGYHFGEQHWQGHMSEISRLNRLFFTGYGLMLLFLLFYVHDSAVSEIIRNITQVSIVKKDFLIGLISSTVLVVICYSVLAYRTLNLKRRIVIELFYLGVFFIVFRTASLLWSFAIYFVIWHSIPSLIDQIKFLYGSVSNTSVLNYIKSSFVYWVISIVGLSAVQFIFKDDLEISLSFFFSFLAAITFPHVLVIEKMNNS